MKSELSDIMKDAGLDAIVVMGASESNPPMKYFVGDAFFTSAMVIIPAENDPVLIYPPMERDNAAKTGMKRINIDEFSLKKLLDEMDGDLSQAEALQLSKILTAVGVPSGKISICGMNEFGKVFNKVISLNKIAPEYEVLPKEGIACLNKARISKDKKELAEIKRMGKVVVSIVADVENYIRSCRLVGERLIAPSGNPVTIDEIKRMINRKLMDAGAENPEGTIFAMGKDAAVPHNSGNDDEVLVAGKTIVFDFFPRDAGSGYFYDFTRTWCIGYASKKLQEAYKQVKEIHDEIIALARPGIPLKELQSITCDRFLALGHKTVKDSPGTFEGYVHTIGHGLGLDVHERPSSGFSAPDDDTIEINRVFTVEPGLYYPEGAEPFGIRIEDTVYIDENGKAQIMAEYPYDLVIPVQKSAEEKK